MSNASDFWGGGGGGVVRNTTIVLQSKVLTIVRAGKYRITQHGASGSGAAAFGGNATGGAAGGYSQKTVDLIVGDTLTFTMGAPGVGAWVSSGSTDTPSGVAGNAAGTTTAVGPGFTMTCAGGGGGKFSLVKNVAAAGAVGGLATGGDVNFQGGGSGSAINYGATGGGAINLYGLAVALVTSGSVLAANASVNYNLTGGASPGGKSGDIAVTVTEGGHYTLGGGSGGPSTTLAANGSPAQAAMLPGPDILGKTYSTGAPTLTSGLEFIEYKGSPYRLVNGGGGVNVDLTNSPGSATAAIQNTAATPITAGAFCGAGASTGMSQQSQTVTGNAPGLGGGSGAQAGPVSGLNTGVFLNFRTADGGKPMAVVEELG
jgi:hypothetical protein